jgi:hypothetical protein
MMEGRLQRLPNSPGNLEDLKHKIQTAWDEIPQDEIDHLISSVSRRVNGYNRVRTDTIINLLTKIVFSFILTKVINCVNFEFVFQFLS